MVLKGLKTCLVIASVLSFGAGAETLDAVLEKAFKQNINYQIALEQLQKAHNDEQTAYGQLFPDLSLSASRSEDLFDNQSNSLLTSYSARLELNQVLYDPTVWQAWKISKLRALDAELGYLRQKQQLVFDVKQIWYQLITNNALALEARQSLARLKQHRDNAQHLYANGKIWRNDLLQADVRVARGEQALLVAENTAKRSLTNLNILLNQNILVEVSPEGANPDISYTPELGQSLQMALAGRPDLQQLDLAVQIARRTKSSAVSGYWPTLTARVTQSNLSDHFDFAGAARDTQLSINMNWTLWDNFSTRNRNRNAVHDLQIAQKNLARSKELVQQETHSAWLAVQEARQNIEVLEKAVSQAEENFRVSGIRYKEQLSTANDVLDAQDLLTSTRSDLLAARGDFFIAKAQLEFSMGTEK